MLFSERVCIFCGRNRKNGPAFALTKEDVWPTWLSKHVPRNLTNYTFGTSLVHEDRTDKHTEKFVGDPRSRRVKLVCASCNNGWMSRLQSRAKPTVLQLVKGESVFLTMEQQHTLATWCGMGVMTADFFSPQSPSIQQSEREALMKALTLPKDTWKIWIGRFVREDWKPHWAKNAMSIVDEISNNPPPLPVPNTQSTTLVFGELYVHASSSAHPWIVSRPWLNHFDKLVQIWPMREQFVAWPRGTLNDREADNMTMNIFQMLGNH